jgi:hypothetical protein
MEAKGQNRYRACQLFENTNKSMKIPHIKIIKIIMDYNTD